MKTAGLIITIFITVLLGFSTCNKSDNSGDEYLKYSFLDENYNFDGFFIEAKYNSSGGISVSAHNSSGIHLTIEFSAETGIFHKQSNENIAIYLEESGGDNYDAYFDDGINSEITINIIQYDDYVKGTFSGILINGDRRESMTCGSFYAKINK